MDKQTYTAVPWRARKVTNQMDDLGTTVFAVRDGWMVFTDGAGHDDAEGDARRIVAAVNAVEGIPTEALEAGVVRELVDVVQRLLDERDKMKDTWEMDHLWEAAETLLTKLRGDADASA